MDALFEAISGVTTTGLSTKMTLVGAPQTFLFARAWMQWYGGLGVVVLSLALIMQPGLVGGGENVELSTVIKDEARFFILIAREEDAVAVKDLKLPAAAKVICYYRDGKFSHADEDTTFRIGDEVVILTHSKNMPALQERWQPKPAPEEAAPEEAADSASKRNK